MRSRKQYILPFLAISILLLCKEMVSGQTNTAYYMGSVPQSYYLNPATQPQCNIFIGIPALSQTYVRATTSGLSTSDILWKDSETDSIITPLHPNADIDDFLNKFGEVESFGIEAGLNLFSFGFRVKDMYFSLDASARSSAFASVSKDFMTLLLKGNTNGQSFDLSDGGFETLEYTEIGINISRRFGDRFQIGIRPKMLFGLATFSTLNNNTTLNTNTEEWILNADYQARIAATGVTIPVDEDGLLDPEGEFEYDSTIISPTGYKKFFSNNRGFGIDIGAHYKPIDRLQLSLSVLDLGYIKWRENTHIATVNGSYTFRGINRSLNDSLEIGEDILDSLKSNLNLTGSDEAFKTTLTPKVIVGGRFLLSPGFDLGLLYRADFYKTYINHDLIFSANWHPIPVISVSGSYSFIGPQSTFGLGLGLNLGFLNIYAILDDVPFSYDIVNSESAPIPLPVAQTDYNVRFGVNLVFGCNQKKKLKQDKAMFNSSDWIL